MKALVRTAVVAIAVLGSSPAFAADAFQSFTGVQGNGGFTYGTTDRTTLTPFTVKGPTPIASCAFGPSSICLQPTNFDNPYYVPQASIGGSYSTVRPVTGFVVLHPGNSDDQSVYGAYTSISGGSYSYAISLTTLGTDSATGIGYTPFTSLGGIFTFGARAVNSNVPDSVVTLTGTQQLTAGQSFGIIIDRNGDYGGDSTGLEFSINAVPEPATWAMMLLGFGMVGFGMRYRRKNQTTKVSFA